MPRSSAGGRGRRTRAELHELEGKQAVMIFVVHDLNPRAMSPKVQGFVQAQSWFQDLTRVRVAQ